MPPEVLVAPRDIVRSGLCIGCGSCVADEPEARMEWDGFAQLKPSGPADWYAKRSKRFTARCPFSPAALNEDQIAAERFPDQRADPRLGRVEAYFVGHVAEPGFRERGSSGGLVSWVAAELLRTGGVDRVAHVVAIEGAAGGPWFQYRLSTSMEQLNEGAKSRYHPITLADTLREIAASGGRTAIVGVPCFIKAVHLARRQNQHLAERITHTLGLFCGHMKSARFVESFAWQLGVASKAVEAVDYRIKDASRPANWYRAHLSLTDGTSRAQDWWHLADGDWGAGFFQNSACNYCDDVAAETADIAFGDAWVQPYSSDGRGTNVAVVRSRELATMLQNGIVDGRLKLTPVSADFVADTQAAGFRQRREGLAYRLTWRKRGIRPVKRVEASSAGIPLRRKLVYRSRAAISAWSHRLSAVGYRTGMPALYVHWAKASLRLYQALTYSRGRLGKFFDRLMPQPR